MISHLSIVFYVVVKVWDDEWNVRLVFVGHPGAVSCLAVYHPFDMHFLSAGSDRTMRVWSLETCDELEK